MSSDRVFLGLGSNLASPSRQVLDAIDAIGELPGTMLAARSGLYRTAPWGISDQPAFVNAVVEVRCDRSPRTLLTDLLAIEAAAGRRRSVRWGPRIIDLDILAWGSRKIDVAGLTVPHPRIGDRDFVLMPWAEIAPDFEIVGLGRVGALAAALELPDRPGPERVEDSAVCTEASRTTVP